MSHRPDASPAPNSGEGRGAAGGGSPPRRSARRPLWVWLAVLASLVVISCLLVSLLTQGLPNAFLDTSVTYAPQQGPPNPALLDSRPETIVQRYLADYISLAGTYPCLQDLSSQYDELDDPVLGGQPCPVTRPVVSYAVTSVRVWTHGLFGYPEATVSFVITYTAGQQWVNELSILPDRYLNLVVVYLHLDCWSTFATLQMFDHLVPDIPTGATYSSPDGVTRYCKDHAGRIIHLGARTGSAPLAERGGLGTVCVHARGTVHVGGRCRRGGLDSPSLAGSAPARCRSSSTPSATSTTLWTG